MKNEKLRTSDSVPIPAMKRLFDITFSLFFLIILSPFFLAALILIFVEHILRGTPGAPLFYVEKRISQGQPFDFVKFNIFNPNVISRLQAEGGFIHTKVIEHTDGGLIFTGRLLQKVYLDELPQLFNVLKGDISLVGPHPVNLEVYEKLIGLEIDTKTVIKAGLTGNFQSLKGLTQTSDRKLDSEYIDFCRENPTWKIVLFDIKILLRTLVVIFRAKGI